MEILDADHRRIVVVAALVTAFLVSVLVVFALLTRPSTQFEREHARATIGNPQGLKVEIATRNERGEYHQGEAIFVVVHFYSAAAHMYKADSADGASISAASDELHISNGEKRPLNMTGIVCCDSRLIGLDDEPFTPPSWTPLKLPPGN